MSIYKSQEGKTASIKLYDEQMKKLGYEFNDKYVTTTFGRTHIIETGHLKGEPLLVFHGGNSTTAYNLLICKFLLKDFHVYAVDTIGHPGKSDEISLSPNNYDYGKWASEVITELGYEKMNCFGSSFGGGILAKLMCVSPEKVNRSVLVVPSGINNAFPISSLKMMIPIIKYYISKDDKYIKECALHMAISEDVLSLDTMAEIQDSFDNVKTKVGMPSNVSEKLMSKCKAQTLVMAGEKDCLFPSQKVLPRAKKIIPNCKVHMLKGCGHMHIMSKYEKDMIVDFLEDKKIKIKQADYNDTSDIEGILLDAVKWMKEKKLENQWNENSIKWSSLSKDYNISDFYICYKDEVPAGCMAITDVDEKYWPDIEKGKSHYLHKLAVKREFASKGISKELIDFAKDLSVKNGANALRLDCNLQRDKLRILYENEGFICAGRKSVQANYDMALYAWHI